MKRELAANSLEVVLTGCSVEADTREVGKAIPIFHQQLNAGQLDAIYDSAGEQLRRNTTKADLARFLSAVHRKLGNFKNGKSVGWNDNVTTDGHFVTETYSAQYDRGLATESFVYIVERSKALLVGYHVNSTALILN